jgi:outer membrane protein TolC
MTASIICLLIGTALCLPRAIAQTDLPVYDLDMCIKKALTKHPVLIQSQNLIKFNEHGIDLAKGEFGPHLSLNSSIINYNSNQEYITIFSTTSGSIATKDKSGTDYAAGLMFTQPIYKSGSFLGLLGLYAPSVEREKENAVAQIFLYSHLRAEVTWDIIDSYGQVLKSIYSLKQADESLKTSEQAYKASVAKYKLDLIKTSDVLETEKLLFQQRARVSELKSALETNLSALAHKVGHGEKITLISEDITKFRNMSGDEEHIPSREKLDEIVNSKRNDIKAQEATLASYKQNLKVINSKRLPEINLLANYYDRGELSDLDNKSWAWNVLIRLEWSLFDFGETSANAARQKDLILVQEEILRGLKNDIVSQVEKSYQTIQSIQARVTSLRKSVEYAKEILALTEEKYKKTLVTEVDLLKVRDLLAQSELNCYEAEIDLIINRVALKKAIGLEIPALY